MVEVVKETKNDKLSFDVLEMINLTRTVMNIKNHYTLLKNVVLDIKKR